jgi:hypothetical protein
MQRLYSGFRSANVIRKDRPLTNDELATFVPSVFSEEKHASRSERYTYIPTISLLDKLRDEGFQPFYACQTKVRDEGKRGHTRHMLRLRRNGFGQHDEVPEIILLNSHDGSSSYQMIPGVFRFVCNNGLVCADTFGEVRVPHKGDVVGQVIDGASYRWGKLSMGPDVFCSTACTQSVQQNAGSGQSPDTPRDCFLTRLEGKTHHE